MRYAFEYCSVSESEVEQIARETLRSDTVEVRQLPCRFSALSLKCRAKPLVLSFLEGTTGGLSSQIAVRLSHDAMIEKVENLAGELREREREGLEEDSLSLRIIREAFKEVNAKVYSYSHSMAAGGQVSASGLIGAFDGEKFAIGQVGCFESFIWRNGELAKFYEYTSESLEERRSGVLQRFIGAHSQILVDLAAVSIMDRDVVIVTSCAPDEKFEGIVKNVLEQEKPLDFCVRSIAREVARQNIARGEKSGAVSGNAAVFAAYINQQAIELKRVYCVDSE